MKSLAGSCALLALIGAGAVLANPATYDAAGRMVNPRSAAESTPPRDIAAPEGEQRALLLPAVQKAVPDQPRPQPSPDSVTSGQPKPVGKALLVVRKPKDTDPAPKASPAKSKPKPKKPSSGGTSSQAPYQ